MFDGGLLVRLSRLSLTPRRLCTSRTSAFRGMESRWKPCVFESFWDGFHRESMATILYIWCVPPLDNWYMDVNAYTYCIYIYMGSVALKFLCLATDKFHGNFRSWTFHNFTMSIFTPSPLAILSKGLLNCSSWVKVCLLRKVYQTHMCVKFDMLCYVDMLNVNPGLISLQTAV